MSPGLIFLIALLAYLLLEFRFKLPLPVTLITTAVIISLLGGFGVPFRHLVEGGFGYFYLVLVLFVGALFGFVMGQTGATTAVAHAFGRWTGERPWAMLTIAAALVFSMGMFAGIAGVAVLAMGVFAVPMLRRIGLGNNHIASFIALQATFGMVAPPVNVPAMLIADGVNMPYADFGLPLLLLSVPPALFTLWYFLRLPRERAVAVAELEAPAVRPILGFLPVAVVLGFWLLVRLFPQTIQDPSTPFVLLAGTVVALPGLRRSAWTNNLYRVFSGPVLMLGAVLIAVGVLVQTMTLTGIRGWLVINAMSLPSFWMYGGMIFGLPLLGGVLTSIGTANVLGVPFAFAFIHQDMILNSSAISAIAALAEFFPPTAISAVLAGYLVGESSLRSIFRISLVPLLLLVALAVLMLVFGQQLAPYLT